MLDALPKPQKIVIASGGFDPVHSGHLNYLHTAKSLGDRLIVGVNSDQWLIRKKGAYFLPWSERSKIVEAFRCVDTVLPFVDIDDTAIDLIKKVVVDWGYTWHSFIFVNGGDRTYKNIPEMSDPELRKETRLSFAFGVGGENKANSSRDILERWRTLPWAS